MLTSDDALVWEDNWQEFISILRTQFGPIDPTADAKDNIDNLKMKDNQHILKYNVEFNHLAVQRVGMTPSSDTVTTPDLQNESKMQWDKSANLQLSKT